MNDKKHISDLLSVDEQKLSILALCLITLTLIAGISYIRSGDISNNIKDIIETFAFLVSGINIANKATEAIKGKTDIKDKEQV